MAKRRSAEQTQDTTPADDDIVTISGQPEAASSTAEAVSPASAATPQPASDNPESSRPLGADSPGQPAREPGDETPFSWVKKASVIVDPEAGVKFHFDYEKHQAIITFDDRPTSEQLAAARPLLNAGGFDWDRANKDGWKKKIRFTQREDDRREAKKTFYAVANAIREQKGLPARSFGEAIPF